MTWSAQTHFSTGTFALYLFSQHLRWCESALLHLPYCTCSVPRAPVDYAHRLLATEEVYLIYQVSETSIWKYMKTSICQVYETSIPLTMSCGSMWLEKIQSWYGAKEWDRSLSFEVDTESKRKLWKNCFSVCISGAAFKTSTVYLNDCLL